jgi:nitroimidazol reductase NimA-like FMN-containing flavoprotein (pyridoxamine 5'-phosphate oxidase superfamily)
MPRTLTQAECEEFFAEPNIAVLSVESDGDRPPLSVPVWYHYEPGGDITFFTGTQGRRARKTRLLEESGRLTMCVQHSTPPYRYVTVEATVVEADRSPSAAQVHAITSRYLPEDMARGFAQAEASGTAGTFVLFTVRPTRWLSFDFGDDQDAETPAATGGDR